MKKEEFCIQGLHDKPITIDVTFTQNNQPKPIVIFSHGFKGFKDWGHFNIVAEKFAEAGFVFVKFNFSHNGTTPENLTEFADLKAFGNNNFCKELDDLGSVIDWISNARGLDNPEGLSLEINIEKLFLLGHSRGGGITILKANEDDRVKKIVTWAAVCDFETRLPKDVDKFKEEGVIFVLNARTNQQMPLYFQFVEDFLLNKQRLNIPEVVKNMKIPQLIVHGTEDESVPVEEAKRIKEWNTHAEILLIEEAGHTFGAKHPFTDALLPDHVCKVVDYTIDFLLKKPLLRTKD